VNYLLKSLADPLNRQEYMAGAAGGCKLTEKTKVFVKYEMGGVNYDLADNIRDSDNSYVGAGAEGAFSSRLSGTVEAGAHMRGYKVSSTLLTNDETTPSVEAQIKYDAPADVAVAVFASRRVQESLFTRFLVSTMGGLSVSRKFFRKLDARILGSAGQDDYPDLVQVGTFNEKRKDTIMQAGLNLSYPVLQGLTARAQYMYRSRQSNLGVYDYKNNLGTVGLTYAY
jgi:hypothetical protein